MGYVFGFEFFFAADINSNCITAKLGVQLQNATSFIVYSKNEWFVNGFIWLCITDCRREVFLVLL